MELPAEAGAIMLILTPPLPAVVLTCGSGKLLTPWSRMHEANLYAASEGLAEELLLVLVELGEDPHAAIAAPHATAVSAIRT